MNVENANNYSNHGQFYYIDDGGQIAVAVRFKSRFERLRPFDLNTKCLVAHTGGSRGSAVFTAVCLFVCLFSARYLKPDAARITELDIQMLHDEFWKCVYF